MSEISAPKQQKMGLGDDECLTCPRKRDSILLRLVILQLLGPILHRRKILQRARELARDIRPGECLDGLAKLAKSEGQLDALLCDRLHCLHQPFELGF
jgi:hypothetical protein